MYRSKIEGIPDQKHHHTKIFKKKLIVNQQLKEEKEFTFSDLEISSFVDTDRDRNHDSS